MSYILEALKKADEKRKSGTVPDLDTLHEVPIVDPRRPLWVYGLAAVLLINAGLIGWWLWSSKRAPAPPALPQARMGAKAPAPAPPSPPVQTGANGHLPPPAPETKAGPPPPANPAEAAKVVPMVTGGPPVTAPAAAQPPAEEPLATSTAPEAAAEERSEEEPPPVAFSQPRPHAKSKVRDQDREDPELAKIPLLKQLPADFRQSLPELHLSFLSYSIHPESRLVSISGKVLREGQDFDDHLKLETITPNGVVMNDQGHRFRLNMD